MEIKTHAKKSTGLDDIFKEYTPQQLEEMKQSAGLSNAAYRIMGCFEQLLYHPDISDGFEKWGWFTKCNKLLTEITIAANTADIDAFIQGSLIYEKDQKYNRLLNSFVSRIIQNSYDQGEHTFLFHTHHHQFNFCLQNLRGKYDHPTPMQIHIEGNVGKCFGRSSDCVNFTILGDVAGGLGVGFSSNCTYDLRGRTEISSFAWETSHCTFIVNQLGSFFGSAIMDDLETDDQIKHDIFKTSDPETLQKLKDNIGSGNRIIFIENGQEKVIRDYHE